MARQGGVYQFPVNNPVAVRLMILISDFVPASTLEPPNLSLALSLVRYFEVPATRLPDWPLPLKHAYDQLSCRVKIASRPCLT